MVKIALIGSTGSIGKQVLNVVRRHCDKFKIVSLSANTSYALLQEQAHEFKPEICTLADSSLAAKITSLPGGTTFYYGENSALHAITEDADIVFVAMTGFAALKIVLEAIKLKKTIALANKETLVAGGQLVMSEARKNGVNIIPVDSEHSAIFQCLNFQKDKPFKNLILTASGGAFRDLTIEQTAKMTAADALKHPTWSMGKKITVDCATMLNKGLEVIEAMWLYNAPLEKVKVLIHPESIVHSMVEFEDSSVIAQMGTPSMEIPIQLALTYPERIFSGVEQLSLAGKTLHFYEVDKAKYPCFNLALESIKIGGNMPCAMNSANEEAVSLFLQDKISYPEIAEFIAYVMSKIDKSGCDPDSLNRTDKLARELIKKKYDSRGNNV